MKKLSKIISTLLAFTVVLILGACTNTNSRTTPSKKATEESSLSASSASRVAGTNHTGIIHEINLKEEENKFQLMASFEVFVETPLLYIETKATETITLSYEIVKDRGDFTIVQISPQGEKTEIINSAIEKGDVNVEITQGMNIFQVETNDASYNITIEGKGYNDDNITFLNYHSREASLPTSDRN